ncbi:MAG TPA: hypothetical protein PKB10_09350, partial [Tepidisphaeraceae bacterium]|nr:hypothetical protein [Tepidisphaeraceae bacterium]
MRFLVCMGLVCLITAVGRADPRGPKYGAWTQSIFGGGGYIQNVVPTSDPNIYYAWVDVAGVFRSDDGGQHWRCLTGNIKNRSPGINGCRGVSVDPSNPRRLVVALGHQWAPVEGLFTS